jgi:hypothetical protein
VIIKANGVDEEVISPVETLDRRDRRIFVSVDGRKRRKLGSQPNMYTKFTGAIVVGINKSLFLLS